MGGTVGFSSVPGQGSQFWIDLPHYAVAPNATSTSVVSAIVPALARAGNARYTIVYIEDNPSNIAFMRHVLEDFEHINLVAIPTAEVGIEVVRDRHPDLVIMDINLPGMSGYEANRRLRDWPETKDIPVIALTAAAMTGDRKHASEAGFRKYLTKPVRIDELMEALEELLNEHAP